MKKLDFVSVMFVLFITIFLFSFVGATHNSTKEELATNCINNSGRILENLVASNFSVQRVNDSLRKATSLWYSQLLLKNSRKKYNFSIIIPYCNEIKKISKEAFNSRDELGALLMFYNESITDDMNSSSIDNTIFEIRSEIKDERYENVGPLIDKGYNQIISIQSQYTAVNLFYQSTTKTIKKFFINYWKIIVLTISTISILLFIFYKTIKKWIVKRKINDLDIKKKVLKSMIQKMQKEYFENGNISERDYNIRTKKFAEIIRDIDRQIPLLKEKLIKIDNKYIKGNKEISESRVIDDKTNIRTINKSKKSVKTKKKKLTKIKKKVKKR